MLQSGVLSYVFLFLRRHIRGVCLRRGLHAYADCVFACSLDLRPWSLQADGHERVRGHFERMHLRLHIEDAAASVSAQSRETLAMFGEDSAAGDRRRTEKLRRITSASACVDQSSNSTLGFSLTTSAAASLPSASTADPSLLRNQMVGLSVSSKINDVEAAAADRCATWQPPSEGSSSATSDAWSSSSEDIRSDDEDIFASTTAAV